MKVLLFYFEMMSCFEFISEAVSLNFISNILEAQKIVPILMVRNFLQCFHFMHLEPRNKGLHFVLLISKFEALRPFNTTKT